MPRFVILYHEMPAGAERESHWDFMLEDGDHLLTWAFDKSPIETGSGEAIQLPNHRLAYLTKEGPISGDRGTVQRIAAGTFEWNLREPDAITVELAGKQIASSVRLERASETVWQWKLTGSA